MKKILLIGSADSLFGLNQILKQESVTKVSSLYGADSAIAKAFSLKEAFQNTEVYIANVHSKKEALVIMGSIKHFNFDYIVPLDIKFSEQGQDIQTEEVVSFADILLSYVAEYSDAVVIMTDNHARDYEHLDHFLDDMNAKLLKIKESLSRLNESRANQLILVANMLNGIDHANALLAFVLSSTVVGNYPIYNYPDAVFDMHVHDIENESLVFFQNNLNAYNSVENLVNFNLENNVYKLVTVDLVIRDINRNMDLTSLKGQLLNATTKLRIKTLAEEYLASIKNIMIRDFEIEDIQITTNQDYTYNIFVVIRILPINSLESCEILIEVK